MNSFKNWHRDGSRAAVKNLHDRTPVVALTSSNGTTTISIKSAAGESIVFSLDNHTREKLLRALQLPGVQAVTQPNENK